MKKLMVLMAVCVFILPVTAEELIGIVDFNLIIEKYEKSKSAQEFLKLEFGKRQQEIAEKQNYLKQKKEKLDKDKNEGKISEEEFRKQTNEFQVEVIDFQRKTQKYEQEIKKLEEEQFEQIRKDIDKAIKEIARKKKIKYVLEKNAVHLGGLDITQEVIDDLNKGK